MNPENAGFTRAAVPPTLAAMTTKTTLRRALPLALVLAGALQAPALADGSLTYVSGGDVHLAAPDGSSARRLTTDGGYAWPSQADDGTIVAARQTTENGRTPRRLHRMDRTGAALGSPLEPIPVDNSFYIGPLAPKISPDGALIAYHYFYTGPITDSTAPRIALTYGDRSVGNGVITSTLGGYFTPSWLQDGRLLAFYAKERTLHVDIWNRDDTVTNWFGDPDVSPLLTDGEVTRAGDRLAAIGNGELRLYEIPGGPPAEPRLACAIPVDASDPTWSPDGRSLAWEEADGIHVAALGDLAACGSAARPLVIAGGSDPDWGVAGVAAAGGGSGPGAGGTPGGGPGGGSGPGGDQRAVRLTVARRSLRTALAKGLTVRVTGAKAGKRRVSGRLGKATVAACTLRVAANGSGRCTLRFSAKGKRTLRAKRRATLRVSGAGAAAKVTLKG